MYVCIDNSGWREIVFEYGNNQADRLVWRMERLAVGEVASCFRRFLDHAGKTLADVGGIMVVTGAGGFTAARVAAVIANTLGLAKQIPVVAVPAPLDWAAGLAALKALPATRRYALPVYSRPPRIGPTEAYVV